MHATFNRFEIKMTAAQARSASHQGCCDEDVRELCQDKHITKQLRRINPKDLCAELKEYGAWDNEELADHETNLQRIVWIAGCNITEEIKQKANKLLKNILFPSN